jgi:uncharacterized membrane protein
MEPDHGREVKRPGPSSRRESVDLLRGVVMVVMVLDHVRDFFGDTRADPTDLDRTTPALFFTRWTTHFCAPVFIFLAGVGAGLAAAAGKSRGRLAVFLLTRGLWLIVLEQTVECVCLFFGLPRVVLALVLWASGWSMIALAGLIFLPRLVVAMVAVGMIALHNLLDRVHVAGNGPVAMVWHVLHDPGFVRLPYGYVLFAFYPLIPWVGVMALGYVLAPLLVPSTSPGRSALIRLGVGLVVGFVAIRAANVYGDPRPWARQATMAFTLMSFLNCTKYPPSLLFLMMTLGPALLLLAALDRGAGPLNEPLRTFGRVPLFYYLLQWPLIHGLAVLVARLRGEPIGWLFDFPPFQAPSGYGHSLSWVYLTWALIVAILYLPCRWYAGVKGRRRDWWLGYL